MSTIVLSPGATGAAAFTIEAPSTATSRVITLPDATDTLVGKATTDTLTNKTLVAPALGTPASGNLANCTGAITSGTAQASTSGTSIDFTGIPSGVKRITVMFNGVSIQGSNPLIQLGAGSVTTSGYVSSGGNIENNVTPQAGSSTAGLILGEISLSAALISGHMVITNVSGNIWVSSSYGKTSTTRCFIGGGNVTLSGTLDRVRITTVNGTDTFDAGSINILYES